MTPVPEERTLLIVEDDRPLRERLARAMEARGFTVTIAESVAQGIARAKEAPPAYAVVDLKLDDGEVEVLSNTEAEGTSKAKYTLADGTAERVHAASAELLAANPLYPGLTL